MLSKMLLVLATLILTVVPSPVLSPRGVRFEANCTAAQDWIIRPAECDVEVLADTILNEKLADGTSFVNSTAYSNYFGAWDAAAVLRIYGALANIRQPYDNPPLTLVCATPDAPNNCSTVNDWDAFTWPDPTPPAGTSAPLTGVGLCQRFFDAEEPTSINLWMLNKTSIDCKNLTWDKIWNAGTWMMHGLVKSEAYGVIGGLGSHPADWPAKNINDTTVPQTHGAADFAHPPGPLSSRNLKMDVDLVLLDQSLKIVADPGYNAFSYAGAATEFYFLHMCGKGRLDAVSDSGMGTQESV